MPRPEPVAVIESASDGPRHSCGAAAGANGSPLLMIKWIDIFETGDAELDALHRRLIEDCNALLTLLAGNGDWPLIVAAARKLVGDCIEHFRVEGALLERIHFPRRGDHAAEHRRLERDLRSLVARMERVDGSLPEHRDLPASLGPSLIDLMIRYDLDYRSHLLYRQGR